MENFSIQHALSTLKNAFGIASCARRLLQRAYSYLDMNLVSKEAILIAKEFSAYTINFYIS